MKKSGSRRKALGKGLDAIIPRGESQRDGLVRIPIEEIRANPNQPRKRFDEAGLAELADSIREKGVIQPLVVRKVAAGYELIAGERRLRAARLAGLETVPAVVKNITETEALELALIENIQREDLNPLEIAEAYSLLIDEFGLSQDEVARRVGKERSTVANYLRLLKLPADIKQALADGTITMGHAKAILSLTSHEDMLLLFGKIVDKALSVRDAEKLSRMIIDKGSAPHSRERRASLPVEVESIVGEVQRRLGARVRLKGSLSKGVLEIRYTSEEELDAILRRLKQI